MSTALQDFGFDRADPVIVGKTFVVDFTIENLTAAQVSSAEWILTNISPVEGTPTPLVTKTVGSGIALTDVGSSLQVTVTVDPGDTSPLAGGDYYHRLDYVHTDGSSYESGRGRGRLTPRA